MKLTVVGATGRTGRHVLTDAARRGHQVTAFTRRPELLPDTGALAGVVTGDGCDPDAVREAVTGADAVIAIVAAPGRRGPHQAAPVLRVITQAMSDLGVRRLVVTSAYPLVAERPRLPLALLRAMLAAAYADAAEMERIVAASDVDWTIVRLNRLGDGPARGGVRVSRDLLDRPRGLTRADAAATLLDVVEDADLARVAVNVAGPAR